MSTTQRHPPQLSPQKSGGIAFFPKSINFGSISKGTWWAYDFFVAMSTGKQEADMITVVPPSHNSIFFRSNIVGSAAHIILYLHSPNTRKISTKLVLKTRLQSFTIPLTANVVNVSSFQRVLSSQKYAINVGQQARVLTKEEQNITSLLTTAVHPLTIHFHHPPLPSPSSTPIKTQKSPSPISSPFVHSSPQPHSLHASEEQSKRWNIPVQTRFLVPTISHTTLPSPTQEPQPPQDTLFSDDEMEDDPFGQNLQTTSSKAPTAPTRIDPTDLDSVISSSSSVHVPTSSKRGPVLITMESIQKGDFCILPRGRIHPVIKSQSSTDSFETQSSHSDISFGDTPQPSSRLDVRASIVEESTATFLKTHPALQRFVENKARTQSISRQPEEKPHTQDDESDDFDWSDIDEAEDSNEDPPDTKDVDTFSFDDDTGPMPLLKLHRDSSHSTHQELARRRSSNSSQNPHHKQSAVNLTLATAGNLVSALSKWIERTSSPPNNKNETESLEQVDESNDDDIFSDEDIDFDAVRQNIRGKPQFNTLKPNFRPANLLTPDNFSPKFHTLPPGMIKPTIKPEEIDFGDSDEDEDDFALNAPDNQPVFDAITNKWIVQRGPTDIPKTPNEEDDDTWLFEDDDDVFVADRYTGVVDFELHLNVVDNNRRREYFWRKYGSKFGVNSEDLDLFKICLTDSPNQFLID
ncbi:hypothetical protein BLNAU_2936 [Blattamonas nauphoetae]|uniref:Uncharacterized protein n=1 Tax=Blattamonas nauphoetae TaxID=2049346 RepID=A0ABQ9YET1_9EUKA|nr:hypothetical protein BLNAU_2936 [Blattamonas nauphoetae]